jgi:hypothetical protein
MKRCAIAAGWFACAILLVPVQSAEKPQEDKGPSLAELSLDVQALRAFYSLQLTDEQLKQIARLARETAEPERQRQPKASNEVRKVLVDLREALIDASDDDKIGDREDELDQVTEKEKPSLDDSFDVTKAARKRTPEVLKLLKADQLAAYYSSVSEELVEPLPRLTEALVQVRSLEKAEWRDKRDEIADEIAWAVAGVDAAKAEPISDKVVALLSKARSLSQEEFQAKKAELEKEAKALVGDVGGDELLRHHAEHTIADLLSNPRLAAAIKAKLKE